MPSRYKALIFDMDGTLIDSMGYWRRQNVEYLIRHNLALPEAYKGHELEFTTRKLAELLKTSGNFETLYEQMCTELEDAMTPRYQKGLPEKPGALAFLRYAHRRGYRMCVATATPRDNAITALTQKGMLPYFEFVVAGGELWVNKSDPAYFKIVTAKLGLLESECAVFEDALYAIKSAKRAGLDVFAIWDETTQSDELEIKKVADRHFRNYRQLMGEL